MVWAYVRLYCADLRKQKMGVTMDVDFCSAVRGHKAVTAYFFK